jgi:transcriptional regulator with XRE-family HTH domain
MKTPSQRGAIGAWAYEARANADCSVEEVVERLTRAGQPVSAATIRGIEAGNKQPSRRLLHGLAKVYGVPAPGNTESPGASDGPGLSDLVAVIRAQTEAITDLVEELRASRQEVAVLQAEWTSFRESLVELSALQQAEQPNDHASAPLSGGRGREGE